MKTPLETLKNDIVQEFEGMMRRHHVGTNKVICHCCGEEHAEEQETPITADELGVYPYIEDFIRIIIDRIAAAQRESDARVCDELAHSPMGKDYQESARDCAAAIRNNTEV